MKVTLFTDPGCPFGFNAQRQELQLLWHYGHAIELERRMIVLAEHSATCEAIGLSPEMLAGNRERLARLYGMPMGLQRVDRIAATIDGRRVVAAGFQPFAVYEVAMASLAPDIERREVPRTAREVLEWAPFALATAEVAQLRGIAIDTAREELEGAAATFTPSANDGYWEA